MQVSANATEATQLLNKGLLTDIKALETTGNAQTLEMMNVMYYCWWMDTFIAFLLCVMLGWWIHALLWSGIDVVFGPTGKPKCL